MFRTLKVALERKIKATIPPDADILKWMIEHGAYLHDRFHAGEDGKTPAEGARGRRSTVPLCCFGEQVLYMPLSAGRGGDLGPKYHLGLFVGVKEGEHIVLTDEGAMRAHSLRRLPEESRYDKDKVTQFRGTPWAPKDGEREEPIPASVRHKLNEVTKVKASSVSERRRVRLEKADFDKHGYTPGCLGCKHLQRGQPPRGHTEKCRKRVEAEITGTPEGRFRVDNAYDKVNEAAASRAEMEIDGDKDATEAGQQATASQAASRLP